ncbi:hypothetical protein Bbelb_365900 [Branchiostoma belcheri]|nr:hypothetical protein Bbelb_365900 [Branchiostoma belcheri]
MNDEDCAEIMYNGRWNDQACTKRRGYICERQTGHRGYTKVNFKVPSQLKTNEAAKQTSLSKLYDLTEHRGYTKETFKVFAQLKTYEAARETCVSHGGRLADIKTQELHDLLLSEIKKVDGSSNYWIGLNDLTVENNWTWSDGTLVSGYVFTNWAPGEPNNGAGRGQDCGQLWKEEGKKAELARAGFWVKRSFVYSVATFVNEKYKCTWV